MNHYPRHIGDWMRDTAHLSDVEECMYSRLVDQYYAREAPLPLDIKQCQRLARARTPESKAAVEQVLEEFFIHCEDGYHQKRCDQEISAYQEGSSEREAKAEHEAERMRRHRERRKELFEALRERGVVPKWDMPIAELQRLMNANSNAPETRTGSNRQREQATNSNAAATAIQNQNQNQNLS